VHQIVTSNNVVSLSSTHKTRYFKIYNTHTPRALKFSSRYTAMVIMENMWFYMFSCIFF